MLDLRILWASNSPHAPTGYGTQTALFTPRLKNAVSEISLFCNYGREGGGRMINSDGIVELSRLEESWGSDVMRAHYNYVGANLLITLVDFWVFLEHKTQLAGMNIAPIVPVDCQPIFWADVEALQALTRWQIAMSRFGEGELRKAGFNNVFYVPHAVDTNIFKPGDRAYYRERLGKYWKRDLTDTFVVVYNAANKGVPSRKNFAGALLAFTEFAKSHENALFYIHTNPEIHYGENLFKWMKAFGIEEKVIFPDRYQYANNHLPPQYLNEVYNAADVYFHPSHAEGFGIPIIEAQAAGCPVIVTDATAMSELVFSGIKVPALPANITGKEGSFQFAPLHSKLVEALEWAYGERANPLVREQARQGALAYDIDHVFETYMLPTLRAIDSEMNAKIIYIPKRGDPCEKGHDWSTLGVYNQEGAICCPCKRKDCTAELRGYRDGHEEIYPTGFSSTIHGITLDLEDDPIGGAVKVLCREAENTYDFQTIPFKPGDVALDIGAHVGVISCYLGKRYPDLKIYAFEPSPENFARLERNLQANDVTNVTAINKAVTADGRKLTIYGNPEGNTGGISAFAGGGHAYDVKSMTLDEIFRQYEIETVKLLKIDCEGAEHEILMNAPARLKQIEHLRGEFHVNPLLASKGFSVEGLVRHCAQFIPDVKVVRCQMSDTPIGKTPDIPDVTVITPTFGKTPQQVERALKSSLCQNGVKIQVVATNAYGDPIIDLARHKTLQDIKEEHPDLKISEFDNQGIAHDFNTALESATGRYVIACEGDDWLEPGCLAAMVRALDAHPEIGFVYGQVQYHGRSDARFIPKRFNKTEFYIHSASLYPIMWRRAFYPAVKYHEFAAGVGCNDWDFELQLIEAGAVGMALPDLLVLHYDYQHNTAAEKMQTYKEALLAELKARHPQLAAAQI